jgi:hypothetical protein
MNFLILADDDGIRHGIEPTPADVLYASDGLRLDLGIRSPLIVSSPDKSG